MVFPSLDCFMDYQFEIYGFEDHGSLGKEYKWKGFMTNRTLIFVSDVTPTSPRDLLK